MGVAEQRRERLARMRLYLITGDQGDEVETSRIVEAALEGGATVGTALVSRVAAMMDRPFVAVGGIDHDNAAQVVEAGARAIAVVRAVYDAPDPAEAARRLHELIVTRLEVAHR